MVPTQQSPVLNPMRYTQTRALVGILVHQRSCAGIARSSRGKKTWSWKRNVLRKRSRQHGPPYRDKYCEVRRLYGLMHTLVDMSVTLRLTAFAA